MSAEKYTPEQRKKLKSQVLSDADIIKNNGEYDETGTLQVPEHWPLNSPNGFETTKEAVRVLKATSDKIIGLVEKRFGYKPDVEERKEGEVIIWSKNKRRKICLKIETTRPHYINLKVMDDKDELVGHELLYSTQIAGRPDEDGKLASYVNSLSDKVQAVMP